MNMDNINYSIQGELKYNNLSIGPSPNNIDDIYEHLDPVSQSKTITLNESDDPWYNNVTFLNKQKISINKDKPKEELVEKKKSTRISKYINIDVLVCCLLLSVCIIIVTRRK